ncbi:MAG: penicillin-binding transpeptidase domain-containing protein [Pontiella sp.]
MRHKREASNLVIWVVFGLMVMGMGLLVSNLWELQVKQTSGFEEVFRNQSVRRVRLPAVRGKIYDKHGECLADSVPNYCIAIFTEELRAPRSPTANTLELMHEIWVRVGVRPDITYRDIQRHLELTPYEPLVAWKDLSSKSKTRWRTKFEEWTAPKKGSIRRKKIPGLDQSNALQGNAIVIQTRELKKRVTTTAANTLELVYEISERIGIPKTVRFQDIKDHIYARRPLPLLAWKNIDEATMAQWADSCSNLAGTDIYYQPARTYPQGDALAHLIGFTLEADAIREEDGGERVHFDMRGIQGRKGLESTYNDLLEGDSGFQLMQIDVSGFHHLDLQSQPAKPGGDLQLTIDAAIQRFAMEALATRQDGEDPAFPVKGAVVVLDPDTGDVLAMVSSPTFDPNIYMQSKDYRQALLKDTSARTYHRAVFGQYPPGSTFKPVVALGVLRDQPDYVDTIHKCKNPYYVGKRRMKCWIHSRGGEHGTVSMREALMYSCNCYMFEMALENGYEPIRAMASEFGFGQYAGLFPNLDEFPEQKDLKYGNLPPTSYNDTDLCNMSIGQGAITASPLQMAMVVGAIANGGRLYRPRLVEKFRYSPDEAYNENPTWEIRRIDVPMEALEVVRGGMHDVVMHEEGTAEKARVQGIQIAGKTGSAQYRKKVDGEVINSVHTWMISYAPFDFPRYAIAMIVEDGVSGGNTIGPRLSQLYTNIFEYDGTLLGGDQ